MVKLYLRFCDLLVRAARVAVIILVAAMTANVLLAVFFRYVMGNALSWSEETARYMMVWMGFLGTGVALREGSHVAMTLFLDKAGPSLRPLMLQVIRGLSLVFLVAVIWAGAVLAISISSQVTPVLRISMAWPYLAIPVGCFLIACETIALMVADIGGQAGASALPAQGARSDPC
jgi:TRAP-type C4-dicarboxylate transport system permease small subunit